MTMRPVLAFVLALCPAVILGGCLAVGPDYHPPSLEAPDRFAQTANQGPGQGHEALGLAAAAWWQSFDDPILNELVTRAMAANLDLAQARARVRQARAEAAIARAALFPTVNVTGSSTTSANGLLDAGTGTSSAGGSTGGSGSSGSTGTGSTSVGTDNAGATTTTTTTLFTAGFDATWEIDIFGGKRREREAAQATLEADIWDLEATRLTLLAEVAENYMELRAAQEQLDIARRNLKSQEETVEVTRERFRLGLTSQLDVAQAEGQAASTAADPPRLTATVSQSIHRLGVLTGQPPESLIALLAPPRPQPSLTGVSASGLPAELLSRRPDLRRAERELAAASAGIGAAVADLYPKFDLTAGLGLQGVSPSNIAGFSTWYWSVVPGVSWPLFDMGKARAGVDKKKALFDETLAAYRQAFHTALEDVENALASYYAESERRQRLAASVAAYEQARRLAEIRYGKGLTTFLDVLVIDAALYAAQTDLSQSEAALRVSLVSLYKALGGGWKAASGSG
ncbi:efflux transporter outer membrane subunit [Desulfovibrio sulfodismutans]|uniref:Efflux transporter outer membrane subunit n=1 Tax=Desulfolutivibrio sulfodismutans TaxID=63561 RepID=A0A7K3NNE9_9BACT|nr:efflux transporter outer membrane subunit [Desulfolutivibrio sulfodismutans]NDY57710.1 efflux transporter outer membrane subunit [Desulfolutivibrio sulfodismutans]QLA10912.1 efflux transporter outer membrane subunit [Desulfolutivibrio sulfodismutans DSM 3696]